MNRSRRISEYGPGGTCFERLCALQRKGWAYSSVNGRSEVMMQIGPIEPFACEGKGEFGW